MISAINELTNTFYSIEEYCEKFGLPVNDILYYKLVPHNKDFTAYKITFSHNYTDVVSSLPELVSKACDGLRANIGNMGVHSLNENVFDRLIISDVHIGLKAADKCGYTWEESEINNRLRRVINYVVSNRKSSKLVIDDLGDFLDGYNNLTTRMGHELEQGYNSSEQFNIGLQFKKRLLLELSEYYDNIVFNCVCNDNHAGFFATILNDTLRELFSDVQEIEVNVINDFMYHYKANDNYSIIITHGKDKKYMKRGFPVIPDKTAIDIIRKYIKDNEIDSHRVIFSKGDSHKELVDYSSDGITYHNHGAFSPPSSHGSMNYSNQIQLFTFQSFTKSDYTSVNIFFN